MSKRSSSATLIGPGTLHLGAEALGGLPHAAAGLLEQLEHAAPGLVQAVVLAGLEVQQQGLGLE
jgi:hypothetical protein